MHPPYQQPPSQPPRQGMSTGAKVTLVGCGGCATLLVVLFVAVGCLALVAPSSESRLDTAEESRLDTAEESRLDTAEQPAEVEESYRVGDAVAHGAWEFTVLNVEEGVSEVEEEWETHSPQGQYVLVELRAKNIGSEPEYFAGRDQVLMDTDGKMYRYDVSASSGFDWLEPVNPGNEVQGVLAFDVPADFELSHLLVNGEGSFADGVRVDVD